MSWKKFTHREHILARPDTYVGPIENVMNKIFQEIIVNASDEYMRDPKCNHIDVTVEGTTVTISNNKCIPVIKHDEEGIWLIELIFGHLLTSSNFDDDTTRYTGGRNGYGAKLTNIFSKRFTVTSCDPVNNLEYSQTWRNNMSICDEPVIKKYRLKSGKFTVSFDPDMSRVPSFQIDSLKEIAIDSGLWVPKVYFNGELVSGNLDQFGSGPKISQGNWEIIVGRSTDGFKQHSFVNGIRTSKGGTHVDYIVSEISKALGHRVSQIKPHLCVCVKLTIDKPVFSSQTKNELESIIPAGEISLKPKFIKDLLATGLDKDLESIEHSKLKKSDGSKHSKIKGIPELDDANWAGTAKSEGCTLIVTEGISAKALAIAGLTIVGRNKYGVFPLRGKPKNVRDSAIKNLEANKEFTQLKQILGLKQGEVYENTKKLRYGKILIMTDADLDGAHIKGLILNMFHVFWPSLIRIGFVCSMVTPVVKRGSEWFYTEESFKNAPPKQGLPTKYYKGLGTSTSAEAKEYFKMIDKLTVQFDFDGATDDSMMLAFSKSQISKRKNWLLKYMSEANHQYVNYGHIIRLPVSEFINVDFIKFSEEDIHRSIPHLVDGLKPSQRNVIYAGKKKNNLEKEINVGQFSGYIGEHTDYHHGETSLHGTIVGLAQDFVGSNNMNLLLPMGQFGSRLEGGSDSASVRYIFTKFAPWTKKIFDAKDDGLVGTGVPKFYVPVLPMCLINGSEGIGTGFSCKIPPFNPSDIKANILRILDREPMKKMNPWFKGFTGTVTQIDETSWAFDGTVRKLSETMYELTELPPGMWTQKFKETLEADGYRYENHSTDEHPKFTIFSDVDFPCPRKVVHTTNMYLVTPNGIRKFESPEEILFEYSKIRLQYYKLRKTAIKEYITNKLVNMEAKIKFIKMVMEGKIPIFGRSRAAIKVDLDAAELPIEMLQTRTEEYTEEKITELNSGIQELRVRLEETIRTSTADMWKKDLNEL